MRLDALLFELLRMAWVGSLLAFCRAWLYAPAIAVYSVALGWQTTEPSGCCSTSRASICVFKNAPQPSAGVVHSCGLLTQPSMMFRSFQTSSCSTRSNSQPCFVAHCSLSKSRADNFWCASSVSALLWLLPKLIGTKCCGPSSSTMILEALQAKSNGSFLPVSGLMQSRNVL